MELKGDTNASGKPEIITTLDHDSLQELFSRCATVDLVQLLETCKTFHAIITESNLIWARRIWKDYSINISLRTSAPPCALYSLAKDQVYNAASTGDLRFQGVLVNGAVDDMNMWYWVDNLFINDRSYFCSDGSKNIDCLALLLDGSVPREVQYNQLRKYMQRRTGYAAALFEQLHNPAGGVNPDDMSAIVEAWSDHQLEHFFIALTQNLNEENPMRRLLLYDIPQDRTAAEVERLQSVSAFLSDRLTCLKQGLVKLPTLKTLFDASCMDKLALDYPDKMVGIIEELELSRAGSLTCPVSAGVVLCGVIDHSQLQGRSVKEMAKLMQDVTQGKR